MLRARRSVRPETNFRLRAHGRDGGECDAGAENEVAAAHSHCFLGGPRRDAIEELEDRGPDHRHHAAVVAVDLEVVEVETARAHELG